MNYEKELTNLADKFDGLKQELARKQGALKNAVASLKNDQGIENAKDAERAIRGMQLSLDEWTGERDKLMDELRGILTGVEGEDVDDDGFEDD